MWSKYEFLLLMYILLPPLRFPRDFLGHFFGRVGNFANGVYWRHCSEPKARCTCSGTSSSSGGLSDKPDVDRLKKLRMLYSNCTLVVDNLEINYITEKELSEAGPNPFAFLETIQEVTGSVIIAKNEMTELTLPNLRVIWGDKLVSLDMHESMSKTTTSASRSVSLFVVENPNLLILDMHSLTAIQRGSVWIESNPLMCHWRTVDFNQMNSDRIQVVIDHNFNNCSKESSLCPSICKSCFGPSDTQCQKIYRDGCAKQCSSGTCFNKTLPQYCCHSECLGGCFGPTDLECYVCKNVKYDNKCIEKCPSVERYVPALAQYERNPDGRYSYNRECVAKCPEHTFVYKDGCVSKCPHHYYEKDRECTPCNGTCPKNCYLNETLTKANIENYVNCTKIEGFIQILKHSFDNRSDGGALNQTDLEILSTVEEVTDYVLIQSHEYLTSFEFLRNLRVIWGRRLFETSNALFVTWSLVKFLGFNSLKTIVNGEYLFDKCENLCYVRSLPWRKIARRGNIKEVRANASCEFHQHVCHESCEPSTGCWGPGPARCYQCLHWKIDGVCNDSCNTNEGYFRKNGKCIRCHTECASCNGPTSRNCLTCRHAKQDGECVPSCTGDAFLDNILGECYPCSQNCYPYGCTGPGNFVGVSGCKRCKFGVLDSSGKRVEPCLFTIRQGICPNITGTGDYFWNAPTDYRHLVETGVCAKCHNACLSCTHYGQSTEVHGCICASHRIHKNGPVECGTKCPMEFYGIERKGFDNIQDCYPCHTQCLLGCTGPAADHCTKCKSFRVVEMNKTVCVDKCPADVPYVTSDKSCSEIEEISPAQRRTQIIVLIICIMVSILLLAVIVVAYLTCRRANKFEKMAMPDEKFEVNLEAKPNLSRLRIIVESELKTGDILGYGAFGTVYKGIWLTESHNRHIKVPVAIKVLNDVNSSSQQEMVEEAGCMARVTHPYLVRLTGICFAKQMMLVTPLMPLGNLLDYVKKYKNKVGSSAFLRWCTQIASGMAYLEECRLVHRDLAARNVLVQNPNHVRITDFGLAKLLEYGQEELQVSEGKMPIKWLALECIRERIFTHKSDVWAFGVTIWELFTFGEKPYKNVAMQEICSLLEKGERLLQPTICTLDVYMLMVKCWMADAVSRPSFKELHDAFSRMSKDPGRYLVIEGDKLLRLPSYSAKERAEIMRKLINDPDLCNPEDYLDSHHSTADYSPPESPSKALIDADRSCRHAESWSWHSPVRHYIAAKPSSSTRNLFATDMENYLLPDSQKLLQQEQSSTKDVARQVYERPVTYTPIIEDPIRSYIALRKNSSTPDNLYYNNPEPLGSVHDSGATLTKKQSLADNLTYLQSVDCKVEGADDEIDQNHQLSLFSFNEIEKPDCEYHVENNIDLSFASNIL